MELVDPVDGGGNIPHLVGVHGKTHVGADGFAGLGQATQIVVDVLADLELDLLESLDLRLLLGERDHLLVGVAEPAGGGGVAGVADLEQVLDTLGLALLPFPKNLNGFGGRERVGHVAEVERGDEFLGFHLAQQQPQRLAGTLGLDVPQRGKHGADGHMLHALLRADPAQLGIMHEQIPCNAHVVEQFLGVAPNQHLRHRFDGLANHIVAAADGEHEADALDTVIRAGGDLHVCGGVVGIGVHRVRTGQRLRGGESEVIRLDLGNGTHVFGLLRLGEPLPSAYLLI